MKIGFDLRWVRGEQIDGPSRYALNLVSHLLQADTENTYVLIGDASLLSKYLAVSSFPNAEVVSIPQPLLSIQDFLLSHREIQRLGVQLLHVPYYLTSPLKGSYRKIITVFDLIPFFFPEALSKSRLLWRWFYKTTYPASYILRSADTIIATSRNTKQDIIRLFNTPPESIHVVWSGIEDRFNPEYWVPESFFQQYALPPYFLLYVGRQDPYKGLNYLVQAYSLLPAALQQQYKLVIAGKMDPRYIGDVQDLIKKLDVQQDVFLLDYFPDADLPLLYSAATLLIHPSLYEGFGLTPLEAMACGTPVVYAETSSLPEVIGDAGFGVISASAESLATGARTLLENTHLRRSFSDKGMQHVQRYSWQRIARNILDIYRDV